jgi:glyoxylase-like metal-dependent hydrolase (beta-lactamase superfamily II)
MKQSLRVIDCRYLRPRLAAAFLRVEGEEAAFIETNTSRALPLLLAALEAEGLKPEQVRYVIVTHAHLDHAGGAAALMAACPRATLVAHPRAARHLIDPSKLERGARLVYGDEVFERLYGALASVPEERVLQLEDGATIAFGSGELRVLHTRGHAKHHFCVLDPLADAIFTGDAFGLEYPDLQAGGLFIFPSTSPTDFEGEEALAAYDRVADSGAGRAFLTHFGEERRLAEARIQLRGHMHYSLGIASEAEALPEAERQPFLLARLRERFAEALALTEDPFLDMDLRLNADGLAWSLKKKEDSGSAR